MSSTCISLTSNAPIVCAVIAVAVAANLLPPSRCNEECRRVLSTADKASIVGHIRPHWPERATKRCDSRTGQAAHARSKTFWGKGKMKRREHSVGAKKLQAQYSHPLADCSHAQHTYYD